MTQDEAIKRASKLLQRLFHDDEETLAIVSVAEANKDIECLATSLDQLEKTCAWLKEGLRNYQKKEDDNKEKIALSLWHHKYR